MGTGNSWEFPAGLRITLDHRGEASKPWPAWDSDRAANVRRICRRIVEPLASTAPERRDARLIDAFARICAAAAAEAYAMPTLDEARGLVADFDRRLPDWSQTLDRRLRDKAS